MNTTDPETPSPLCGQLTSSADNLRTRQPLLESSPDWQRARQLGRREALEILMRQNAEGFPDEFQQSRPLGDTGDFLTVWDVDKLADLFDAKKPASLIEYLDAEFWRLSYEVTALKRERDEAREVCDKIRDMLVREIAKQKNKHEIWMRLCFDMLSVYKEGKDFNVTQERVECWREEWNNLTGMNYADY